MRRAAPPSHGDFEDPRKWIDPRTLVGEPKTPGQKLAREASVSAATRLLQLTGMLIACYLIGVHEMLLTGLTSVTCSPEMIKAGSNATCEIRSGPFTSDSGLSITQVGVAGRIALVDERNGAYRIVFATRLVGDAGVRVSHGIFSSVSTVEVIPGPAIVVEAECSPPRVAPSATVTCAVTPRDRFGNAASVEKPEGADDKYFALSGLGSARELAIHDFDVTFKAGNQPGERAGIAVTLNGGRVESTVQVVAPTS